MGKLCPRCRLTMNEDPALNARSHKGNVEICTTCAQIEGYRGAGLIGLAEGLEVGQRRVQAALYGLDKDGQPKLPPIEDEEDG